MMPLLRKKNIKSINPNEKLSLVQVEILFFKAVLFFLVFYPTDLFANNSYKTNLDNKFKSLVNNGSILVADDEKILYKYPSKKVKLIPASVIKLSTALAAIHYLGLDFQFSTDFFLSNNNSLIIRGRGDPFLVSEALEIIVKNISGLSKFPKKLRKLTFDTTFFGEKIQIPGIELSTNPYDARNGALVVNFNTVFVKVEQNGTILSGEKQTPLTPLAKKLGEKMLTGSHRISLPLGLEIPYAGEVFQEFFGNEGISFDSPSISLRSATSKDKHIYTYKNKMKLSEIIAGMMLYSNNFIANQLLLTIGFKKYGAPSSLHKGKMAIQEYLVNELNIPLDQFDLIEGSGISRKNLFTSEAILYLLKAFSNLKYLLNNYKGTFLKTGTLRGVYTMAGYLGDRVFFVILLNQQKNNRDKVLDILLSTDFVENKF